MNLLNSVLRTSNAENYMANFEKCGIDIFTLKITNDEDLQLLGIDDENIRNTLLKHARNLQIPAEKINQIVIDQQFLKTVLSQMSLQLDKHLASLVIAVNRKDVMVCDVKLLNSVKCLGGSIDLFEKQLERLEKQIVNVHTRRQVKKRYCSIFYFSVIVVGIVFLTFKCKINK